ncbi:MAG TPA: kelch repeat-containing protein [Cytophagales bacterium]
MPRPVARQGVAHRNALACLLLLAAWGPTLLAQTVGSTEINWTTVAAQAYPNAEAQGTVVNGKLYVFGGFDSQKPCCTPASRAYVYNPATNAWSSLAPMPAMNGTGSGGVTHAGFTTDGRDIYFAGGYTSGFGGKGQIFGTKEVWRYNVGTNTYTRLPDLPVDRAAGQLVYLNGELHHIGGTNKARTLDVGDHYVLTLQPLGTSWRTAAALPNPRHHAGAAVLNGKIYYIGGQRGHDHGLVTQTDVHVFDPATGAWTKGQGLPRARGHIAASTVVHENRIFVLGGEVVHGTPVPDVTAYNPATNTWSTHTALPAGRASGVAGTIGGALYYTVGMAPGSWSRTTYKGTFPPPAAGNACGPVSTLPCPQTKVALPVNLYFNGGEGGLGDKSGSGTGFRMADKPSARLAADGAPAYPGVPGYEPSKLTLSNSQLHIVTNKGLAHLHPGVSSETNSQINALGVGFLPTGKFRLETALVNPYTSTKTVSYSEQGGLWLGLNEDNYVKLAVVALAGGKHEVELRRELNAASGSADVFLRSSLSLGNATVKLILEADPSAGTVKGSYSVNGGTAVTVGTLSLPAAFFTGKTLSDNATKATFAGIYASHRRASTAVTFSFENFRITPVTTTTTQVASAEEAMNAEGEGEELDHHAHDGSGVDASLRLYPNPVGDRLYVQLPFPGRHVEATAVTDATGRVRLRNAHTVVGEDHLTLAAESLPPGLYVLTLNTETHGVRVVRFAKR